MKESQLGGIPLFFFFPGTTNFKSFSFILKKLKNIKIFVQFFYLFKNVHNGRYSIDKRQVKNLKYGLKKKLKINGWEA